MNDRLPTGVKTSGGTGRAIRIVAVAAVCCALAACDTLRELDPGIFTRPAPAACPRVGILGEAETLVRFRPGSGRDIRDVEFEAEMGRINSRCDVDDGRLDVEVVAEFLLKRGPGDDDRTVSFGYFIAQVDPSDRVLFKQDYIATATFPPNAVRQVVVQTDSYGYALRADDRPRDIRVFVGLQLTEEELTYNRARRR